MPTSRGPIRSLHASVNRRSSALSKPCPLVIIVSEPSAEAARRIRMGRYTPARSRSSAAHNDPPRYADAWQISVHTEVLIRIYVPSGMPGIILLADIKGT